MARWSFTDPGLEGGVGVVELAVVVTSDRVYRGEKEDRVLQLLREPGISERVKLVYYTVVPNDPVVIREKVLEAARASRLVLVTGGTGVSPRDISVDVVRSIASKELPGFGELHRRLSMEEIGFRAILSRASAFIVDRSLVAVSPGSRGAVRLAVEILYNIYNHLIEELEGMGHGKH